MAELKWHRKGGRDVATDETRMVIVRPGKGYFEVLLQEPGEAGATYKSIGKRTSREAAKRSATLVMAGQSVSDWGVAGK